MTEQSESHELIKMDAIVGIDEVAAIKVAEVEGDLIEAREVLKRDLSGLREKAGKVSEDFSKSLAKETRASYKEIGKLESVLKTFFAGAKDNYGGAIEVSFDGQISCSKVTISLSGYRKSFPIKSKKLLDAQKEFKDLEKAIKDKETVLTDVKKRLSMLSHLERRVKAGVARAKLSSSKEGKKILDNMDKIKLPALPSPKRLKG